MSRGPTAPVEQQDVERLTNTVDALLAEVRAIKRALGIVIGVPIAVPPIVSTCTCGTTQQCPVHRPIHLSIDTHP